MTEKEIVSSKPVKRLKQLLTVGNLWLYILSLIKRNGKMYAYTLDDEIESAYFFKPGKVMIYLVLYKLEGDGMIKAESIGEERRKYYRITKKGEETLDFAKQYFVLLSKGL